MVADKLRRKNKKFFLSNPTIIMNTRRRRRAKRKISFPSLFYSFARICFSSDELLFLFLAFLAFAIPHFFFSSRSTSYEKLSAVIIMTRWQKQIKKLHLISMRGKNAIALRHIPNKNKLSYQKKTTTHLRSFG